MKILVTGGAGFIGGHLIAKLTQMGHEVIGIDNFFHATKNPQNEVIQSMDIRDVNLENLIAWSDIVYHLAAIIHVDYSIQKPVETFDVNVNGTIKILEIARRYNKKVVFASSSEIYGSTEGEISEDTRLNPQSPYAVTKLTGDKLCTVYRDIYGTKIDVVRNFNTFGEWQNDTSYGGVIAIFTRKALTGEPLTIYGDGTQERDYMYVDDALQGYLMSLTQDFTEPINFGTGQTITINDLARFIKEVTNSTSEIIHVKPRPGEVQRLCANTTKAKLMGFSPQTNLKEDLKKYCVWYANTYNR